MRYLYTNNEGIVIGEQIDIFDIIDNEEDKKVKQDVVTCQQSIK